MFLSTHYRYPKKDRKRKYPRDPSRLSFRVRVRVRAQVFRVSTQKQTINDQQAKDEMPSGELDKGICTVYAISKIGANLFI